MSLRDVIVSSNLSVSDLVRETIEKKLKTKTEQIMLFGAGVGGANTLQFLKQFNFDSRIKCFIDNNPLKWNTTMCGLPILSCEDAFGSYEDELIIISCGEGDEIISQLQKYQIPPEMIYVPDISAIDETDRIYIFENLEQLEYLYDELGDIKSKEVLSGVLNYKITHDMKYLENIADKPANQYFDSELIEYSKDDVFLDCGAYIGDTAIQYIAHSKGQYKKIICIEADEDNCKLIEKIAQKHKIDIVRLACWNSKREILFDKIGSGSGNVLRDSDAKTQSVVVKADTIDAIVGDENISFIKMDIEGAEYEAILGAEHTIKRSHPTMMISVYHKQDDLVQIPKLINSFGIEYVFYLRHYRSMSIQETILYAIAK